MKPLYATLEDRMLGRAQREMTDEEKKDLEIYCEAMTKLFRIPGTGFGFADIEWRDQMIRDLREALKFYADKTNYLQSGWPHWSSVDSDNGKVAREALEKKR